MWKQGEAEFGGIRVRQQRDFTIEADWEDYTNKFVTEAPISRYRANQRQEMLTSQELSVLRRLGFMKGTADVSSVRRRREFSSQSDSP